MPNQVSFDLEKARESQLISPGFLCCLSVALDSER